jgi:D-alanyl-lipoteichoic acid acyltransferase DltB (MBOAT superfamily)
MLRHTLVYESSTKNQPFVGSIFFRLSSCVTWHGVTYHHVTWQNQSCMLLRHAERLSFWTLKKQDISELNREIMAGA